MRRNYGDVAKTDNFLHLSFEELDALLSFETVFVASEDTLLESILTWSTGGDEEGYMLHNRSLISFPRISLRALHCDNVFHAQGFVTCFLASSLWLIGRTTAAIQPRQVLY